MAGRSIRIYLVDGDASGLLTAEVMNWSGKFVVSPRTMLKELAIREEVSRTGVYILAGPDPENPAQDGARQGPRQGVLDSVCCRNQQGLKLNERPRSIFGKSTNRKGACVWKGTGM